MRQRAHRERDTAQPGPDGPADLLAAPTVGNRSLGRMLTPREADGVDAAVRAVARIHTGPEADLLARRLATRAFTVGTDVVLSRLVADGASADAVDVVRHELAHVAQQRRATPPMGAPRLGPVGSATEHEAAAASTLAGHEALTPLATQLVQRFEEPRTSFVGTVTERPLEAVPTDLDPAVKGSLDFLLSVARGELKAWERFRTDFEGGMPGFFTLPIGSSVYEQVYKPASNQRSLQLYLALALGSERLYLLREMLSFWRGEYWRGSMAMRAFDVAEMFGLSVPAPEHAYTIAGNVSISGKVWVGGKLGTATITYRNALGMTFKTGIAMGNVEGGLKVGVKGLGKLIRRLRGRGRKGKGGDGGEPVETSESESGDKEAGADDRVDMSFGIADADYTGLSGFVKGFWSPSDFGRSFPAWPVRYGILDASPSASAKVQLGHHDLTLAEVKARLYKEIVFYSDGTRDLRFDLYPGTGIWDVSGPSSDLTRKPGLDVDAEINLFSAGYGFAWRRGEAVVESPEVPGAERRPTGRWVMYLRESVFFDTGSAELDAEAVQTVGTVREAASQFWDDHPDYNLRVRIIGHASPRWRHPQRGEIPESLNAQLAQQRAEAVEDELAQLSHADRTAEVVLECSPGEPMAADWDPVAGIEEGGVHAAGSLEGLSESADPDDDWWGYRRVDIVVLRDEIGVATHEPGPLPPRRAE